MSEEGQLIAESEKLWSESGFFGDIRSGKFNFNRGEDALKVISRIQIKSTRISRRIAGLLWMMPLVLEWNRERATSRSRPEVELQYREMQNRLQTEIGRILGCP